MLEAIPAQAMPLKHSQAPQHQQAGRGSLTEQAVQLELRLQVLIQWQSTEG